MNIQKYASIYANFHNTPSYDIFQDIIILSFASETWIKSIILKMMDFQTMHIPEKKPLVYALRAQYKTEAPCTLSRTREKAWTLLFGNDRIIYPSSDGKVKLYATPFFVKNPSFIEPFLHGVATKYCYENIYAYKNMILYLDETDVPYPGGHYFDKHEPNEDETMYRLCFLAMEGNISEEFISEWRHKKGVYNIPYKTTTCKIKLPIIPFNRVPASHFPDAYTKGTSLIHKFHSLKYPTFFLHDILQSYLTSRHETSVDNLGLFIECPFRLSFEGGTHYPNDLHPCKTFLALSVNCNEPKKVLHVQEPYDRYIEYNYVPNIPWTPIYAFENTPSQFLHVVLCHTVIGFRYKNVFLCLNYPMLNKSPIYPKWNTECLFNTFLEKDLLQDDQLRVIETFSLDCKRNIHRVRLDDFRYDLWCISKREEEEMRPQTRSVNAPYLVKEWLFLFTNHKEKESNNFGDLNVLKLALVMARHNICFSVDIANDKNDVLFKNRSDILLRLDKEALTFLNAHRLSIKPVGDETLENEQEGCRLM